MINRRLTTAATATAATATAATNKNTAVQVEQESMQSKLKMLAVQADEGQAERNPSHLCSPASHVQNFVLFRAQRNTDKHMIRA